MRAFDRRDDIHSAENGPPAMTSGFQKVASIRPAFHARAFFSGLPGVASACSVFGIAAGSPPSLYDGDLLRPHRSPYCLRACASGNLIEKRSKRRPVYSKAPLIQLKTQKFEQIFESGGRDQRMQRGHEGRAYSVPEPMPRAP